MAPFRHNLDIFCEEEIGEIERERERKREKERERERRREREKKRKKISLLETVEEVIMLPGKCLC